MYAMLQEPKTYTDVKTVRLAGCTMAEHRAVFQPLSPKKNHRAGELKKLYDLEKEENQDKEKDGTEINRSVERRERGVFFSISPSFLPSGCVFSSLLPFLSPFFRGQKHRAAHSN